ncbi:hypothetical protein BU15DRAFT_85291 [Melanogaster broomeanus]|nr:hypothetical protein BU15DRAFT_85291 [Melanogaster broomeanus]
MTLKQHYPPEGRVIRALTAVQFISMHLFLWRPKADEDSGDPHFGPYISILPRNFDSHPLTWLRGQIVTSHHGTLLQGLPPSVLVALHQLHSRLWADWCKMQQKTPLVSKRPTSDLEMPDAVMDFLWAWLNGKPSSHMTPVPSNADIWNGAPVKSIGDGLKFISPENAMIQEGDEIHLTYGSHSNKTLFVEYGFVNSFHEDGFHGEVDVTDVIEELIFKDLQRWRGVSQIIQNIYKRNWTLHSTSDGAQPSWRLITALRLHHLAVDVCSTKDDNIQGWRDVVAGKRERISDDNERAWRETVVLLCDVLISRAEHHFVSSSTKHIDEGDGWIKWTQENIRALWREELFVASAVKQSVLRGDEF